LLTFETGPGKTMGNIYFGTWVSLFLSLDILITTIKAKEENSVSGNENIQETTADLADRDAFFGVAHDRLEIQVAGWSSGRTSSFTRRVRKALSSIMFSSIGEWSGPSQRTRGSETSSSRTASPEAGTTTTTNSPTSNQAKQHKLTRLEFWIILLLLSCVCVSALVPILPAKGDREPHEIYALAVPSVSIGLALFGYVVCLMPQTAARCADLILVRPRVYLWSCK
jgi:hypothetical protein